MISEHGVVGLLPACGADGGWSSYAVGLRGHGDWVVLVEGDLDAVGRLCSSIFLG